MFHVIKPWVPKVFRIDRFSSHKIFVALVRTLFALLLANELSGFFFTAPNLVLESSAPGAMLRRKYGVSTAAIYFPQFHNDVNNDIFWGRGFSEWNHFKNVTYDIVAKRGLILPEVRYSLDLKTLFAQAKLAKSVGVNTFVFYTYWFEHGRTALWKPLSKLRQRRLGISFCVTWANEPWSRRWDGISDGRALIEQRYGSTFTWARHFEHLLPLFRHPEYEKLGGKPIMFIYNIEHIKEEHEGDAVLGDCSITTVKRFGPGGREAAEIYSRWYADLNLIPLDELYTHYVKIGQKEGRSWPLLECAESPADREKRKKAEAAVRPNATYLTKMTQFLDAYARVHGFPGLHFVGMINAYVSPTDIDQSAYDDITTVAQFAPFAFHDALTQASQRCGCNTRDFKYSSSTNCPAHCGCVLQEVTKVPNWQNLTPGSVRRGDRNMFRGAFLSWSNFPRHMIHYEDAGAYCSELDFDAFSAFLQSQLLQTVSDVQMPSKVNDGGNGQLRSMVIINAWNEWGEQAVLEPSSSHGTQAVTAVKNAVEAAERSLCGLPPADP